MLERSGTSGNFSIENKENYQISGNTVMFTVDIDDITNNYYYTMGISEANAGYCLNFDNANTSDKVELPITRDLSSGRFTAELWFKVNAIGSQEVLIGQANGTGTARNILYLSSTGKLRSKLGNSVTSSSTEVAANKWHHAAISYNGTNLKLYVDGIHEATESITPEGADGNWYLGISGASTLPFDGSMDEVRIWNDVRTDAEIRKYMNRSFDANGSDVVAYYRFDQFSGSYLPDVSSNSNGGTLSNFALSGSISNWIESEAPVVGKAVSTNILGPGNGLEFDGSGDYVELSGFLDPSSSNWTFEVWLHPNALGLKNILSQQGGTGSNMTYLVTEANGKFSSSLTGSAFKTDSIYGANEWIHVAISHNSGSVKYYFNGIFHHENNGTISSADGDIYLGRRATTNLRMWDGMMDEIRFWSTTRTSKEIQENMYAELEGTETGLLAYYSCDQVSGSTLTDQLGSNNGTLNDFSTPSCWVSSATREPFKTIRTGTNGTGATWKGGTAPTASTDHLAIYHNVTLSSTDTYESLQVNGDAAVTVSADINVTGNVIVNGSMSGTSNIVLNGSEKQHLAGEGTLGSLQINNSNGINLRGDMTIGGALTLTSGHLEIGNNTLTLSGTTTHGSSTSYLKMDGDSKVKATVTGDEVIIPVGRNPYLPVVLSSGDGAEFTVGLSDGVYSNPTTNTTELTSEVVSETWTIQASQTVTDVNIQLGWDAAEESGFDRTTSGIGYWENGVSSSWQRPGSVKAATGSGPYFQTRTIDMSTNLYYLGVGGTGSALPVELTYFRAKWQETGENAQLTWQTAMEEQNSHFEVERSFNGQTWEQMGRVEGAGNSISPVDYVYTDQLETRNSQPETVYYRLKQIDYNGNFEYSPVRTLNQRPETRNSVSVYPNPAKGKVQIASQGVVGEVQIFDVRGKQVLQSTQSRTLDISSLSRGIYTLKIYVDGSMETKKLRVE